MDLKRAWLPGLLALLCTLVASANADNLEFYTVDVGTGLGIYFEMPNPAGDRPFRVIYDTGKGASKKLDNDLVKFLTSPEIGLAPAQGDFEGDVIDYFILSHPHEDHFNGALPVFDVFDVRNVIESKQIPSIKYLKRFKAPALAEIYRAKQRGLDAHYYVVGLPYPNGFDEPREGKPYDEYALAEEFLPDFLKGKIDPRKYQGKVRFPFGPDQVSQPVEWPIEKLMAGVEKAMRYVPEEMHGKSLEVDVLPVGTHFRLGRHGAFTVVHADTIAALDAHNHESDDYQKAWPFYRVADLNDGSLSIQVRYKRASIMIPGDTEGRQEKPTEMVELTSVFGSGEGEEGYTQADLENHLRRNKPEAEQLPILPEFEKYIVDAKKLLHASYHSYVTMDYLTPEGFEIRTDSGKKSISARSYTSPQDIDPEAVYWNKRSEFERDFLYPTWQNRLFQLYGNLKLNRQKWTLLKTRFNFWTRGANKRMIFDQERQRFLPDWNAKVWNVTNLVQLVERIYYVDPGLANVLAGFILRSDLFLEYLAPKNKRDWALRGEKHMIHVADQILKESKIDVLDSDVLLFGHHGSFTSSSLGFVLRVNPNVGIISADDKSYSGSTLPDFSSLFWNMNSHHPSARKILHSLFFHADKLALARGEPVDGYAYRNRYSQSASRVFRARRRWAIPTWRTDWNDDLENVNTLYDNLALVTDGSKPIWDWARHRKKGSPQYDEKLAKMLEESADDAYWAQDLISAHPPGSEPIRPVDPSGVLSAFTSQVRAESLGLEAAPRGGSMQKFYENRAFFDEDELEAQEEAEDFARFGHHH